MTAEELFRRLAPLLAPHLEEQLGRQDFCIYSTKVALDVGRYFGVVVRAQPCKVIAYNAQYAKHIASGIKGPPDWSDGSYSVGCGFGGEREENKWNAHLIAVADGWFGDFSIRQTERVEKGIITGPALVGPWSGAGQWIAHDPDTGTTIEYRSFEDESYQNAPDWRRRKGPRRLLVGALIRTLRT